ncbi:unnamed protein product (macronuclear) [Paramecium tetraurelia]|uniref:Cytochrome b561 domain-containing protein n=1 Tax=Paramecium tetraurelia TaxID=5888 RepID=A0EBQ5_PARTE|nr:uncharacterized protein GSPATT00025456001 [Paramecium tetraurelia]CAK92722.1 unnamed protein product [Paramecium tetraurelia]|eukprot:XP_001460119.1 hypothetical protein (macronuclear) [Paramecium tetraurelia strain d4-2]
MYNTEFWVKYVFRVLHIGSVTALGGRIIYDYLWPDQGEITKSQALFAGISGFLMILAGIVNIFLLKGKEKLKSKNKFWAGTLHLKAITTIIILTPLAKFISRDQQLVKAIQFYYVVAMLLLSPFLRFYREWWTELNRQDKLS